jgi:hypothetical protein
MGKRLKTKIGDIFSAPINDKEKRFFQLIAFDLLQLNSDVIRCFGQIYPIDANPTMGTITNDNVLFYAHCATDFGLQLNLWVKVGNSANIGNPEKILFRDTNDYARKEGHEPIKVSNNWYVWRIGDKQFTRVGELESEYKQAFIGLVFNPYGILELVKGNDYPLNYPNFE